MAEICLPIKSKELYLGKKFASSIICEATPEPPCKTPSRPTRNKVLNHLQKRFNAVGSPGSDHALAFLTDKYRQGLSANTISTTGKVVLSFLSFLEAEGRLLTALTRTDLGAYVEAEQDRGLAITTVENRLNVLYPFISFLVFRKVLPPNILENRLRLKTPNPLPRAIPSEDLARLFAAIDDIRDRTMVLLLLRTGMRIGELLELTVADINLPEQKIMIYIGEKNYQGRAVYFSCDAREALLAWLKHRAPDKRYLFYGRGDAPLSYVAAWRRFAVLLQKAGLIHKSYSLHSLRHTFATEVLNAGMRLEVVQQLLGHQSIEMTRRYARLSDSTREEEYFKAMARIEKGETADEHDQFNDKLQAVFKKKKLFVAHN